jgi:hypothetical protein
LPVEVEKSSPLYTPMFASLTKQEEIVIVKPSRVASQNASDNSSPDDLLLSEGQDFVTVDAHFELARLGDDVIDRLQRDPQKRPLPRRDLQPITYTTAGDEEEVLGDSGLIEQVEPCRTSIHLIAAQEGTMPTEIHFLQSEDPGSNRHRYLEMRVLGANIVVQLFTRNLASSLGELRGPNCRRILSVGNSDWVRTFSSPLAQTILVPDGATFRFSFTAYDNEAAWSDGKDFEAFRLAALPLTATEVRKIRRQDSPTATPLFSARGVESNRPLTLKRLLVGSDELQLDFAGKAMVQEAGKHTVTFNLLEFAKQSPLLAGLLAMVDLALLEWLRRIVFSYKRKKAAGFRSDS